MKILQHKISFNNTSKSKQSQIEEKKNNQKAREEIKIEDNCSRTRKRT